MKNPYKIYISYFDTCSKCYNIVKKIINFDIFDVDVILWLLYERIVNLFRWKSLTIEISALSYHFKVLLPLLSETLAETIESEPLCITDLIQYNSVAYF